MNDLRYAIRLLAKNPGFTVVAALTLALGIGANTAIFSVVDAVLLRPLPYHDPNRLVMLWENSPRRSFDREYVSPPDFADWRAESRAFGSFAFWSGEGDFNLLEPDGVAKVKGAYAVSDLFPLLGVKPLLGRAFLPEEDLREGNRAALISYELWQRRFAGRADALGQTLTVDTYGRRDYTIVGVMPPGFRFPDQWELWLPAGGNGLPENRRGGHWLQVIARLRPGVTLETARAEMNAIQARIERAHPEEVIGSRVAVVPLLEQTVGRNMRPALLMLWGVVACVLLIACSNVANLLLARSAARQKESALRLALGASRRRVARQLLTESLLLALAGGALGTVLAVWGLSLLVTIGAHQIPRLAEVRLDVRSLGFTFMISLLTSVIFGLAPAWQLAHADLNETLKDNARGATGGLHRDRLRGLLVVSEIALSLVLLIGTGLMTRSFVRMAQIDRGFQPAHLLTAGLDFSVSGFTSWIEPTATRPQVTLQEIMERLKSQPGVQSVAAASKLPHDTGSAHTQPIVLENRPPVAPGEFPTADFQGISPDYFHSLGIPLLHGRAFAESDAYEAPRVAVINEAMARRYFPNENPIGKRLAMGNPNQPGKPLGPNPNAPSSPWTEIVGVVADIKSLGLNAETAPTIYVSYWQWPMQSPTLLVRTTTEPSTLAAAIRGAMKAVNKNLPEPKIQTMDQIVADTVAEPRFYTLLLGLFGVTALVLAVVGVYGVVSYAVAQRMHEFGIRMALGAQGRNVISLIIGQGIRLVLLGISAGILASFALTRMMRGLLYEVTPTDPLTFLGASLLLTAVAFVCLLAPGPSRHKS